MGQLKEQALISLQRMVNFWLKVFKKVFLGVYMVLFCVFFVQWRVFTLITSLRSAQSNFQTLTLCSHVSNKHVFSYFVRHLALANVAWWNGENGEMVKWWHGFKTQILNPHCMGIYDPVQYYNHYKSPT